MATAAAPRLSNRRSTPRVCNHSLAPYVGTASRGVPGSLDLPQYIMPRFPKVLSLLSASRPLSRIRRLDQLPPLRPQNRCRSRRHWARPLPPWRSGDRWSRGACQVENRVRCLQPSARIRFLQQCHEVKAVLCQRTIRGTCKVHGEFCLRNLVLGSASLFWFRRWETLESSL